MRDRVLLKSALLLALIVAGNLVDASENDDLVFDQDGKLSVGEVPLIETHQEQSFFHRIKRGFFDLFKPPTTTTTTTTTTTEIPQEGETNDEEEDDGGVDLAYENVSRVSTNTNKDREESFDGGPSNLKRLTRDSGEDNEEDNERDNEIGNVAEGRRTQSRDGNTDDEDLAGSGEIEGSATETDLHNPDSEINKFGGKARFYRITLTVGEPYRGEYADRNSWEYKELSGNLTQAIEDLYERHIPNYKHFANIVKISPMSDAFTSQVTLDIGSTFTDELLVRGILEQQLQLHSLGTIQVDPEGFTFRIFQADEDAEQECDQSTELRCRNGACVRLDSRCDGIAQCEDASDEEDCPVIPSHRQTNHSFHETSSETGYTPDDLEPIEPTEEVDEESTVKDYDEHTLSPANKCRADDTVRCQDGSRDICSVQQCDGTPDCDDGGDEVGCPHPGCNAGEFACDVSRCILDSQRCNFVQDCQDGSDEHDCNYPACNPSEFKCRNGECIVSSAHCNGVRDCHDGSDEHNCPCRDDQFECTPGYCVPLSRRCDGYRDCSTGMDEANCQNTTRCRPDEFQCSSGSCVSKTARCDGRVDCPDRSDEYNCNVTTCSGDQFRCLDGICLSIDKRCNGVSDCRNGEDESQCGCGDAEFRCTDGRCIGYELQCNGMNECTDGSDERDCVKQRNSHSVKPSSLYKTTRPRTKGYTAGFNRSSTMDRPNLNDSMKMYKKRRSRKLGSQFHSVKLDSDIDTKLHYQLPLNEPIIDPIAEAFPELLEETHNSVPNRSNVLLNVISSKKSEKESAPLKNEKYSEPTTNFLRPLGVDTKFTRIKSKHKLPAINKRNKRKKHSRVNYTNTSKSRKDTRTRSLLSMTPSTFVETENNIGTRHEKLLTVGAKNDGYKSNTDAYSSVKVESMLFEPSAKVDAQYQQFVSNDQISKSLNLNSTGNYFSAEQTSESIATPVIQNVSSEEDKSINGSNPESSENEISRENIEGYKAIKHGALSKYYRKHLKGRFTPSPTTISTTTESDHYTDKFSSVMMESSLFGSREKDNARDEQSTSNNPIGKYMNVHSIGNYFSTGQSTETTVTRVIQNVNSEEDKLFNGFGPESSENEISRENIEGYKAIKHGAFSKYYRKNLKGRFTPNSTTVSTATESGNYKRETDEYSSVKVEKSLFESNAKDGGLDKNVLSKDRVVQAFNSDELSSNASTTMNPSYERSFQNCTSKCAKFWRRMYETQKRMNAKKLLEREGTSPKTLGNIDSGLIVETEIAMPGLIKDNCTDKPESSMESIEVFDTVVLYPALTVKPQRKTTESSILVELITADARSTTERSLDERKTRGPKSKKRGKKGKKSNGKKGKSKGKNRNNRRNRNTTATLSHDEMTTPRRVDHDDGESRETTAIVYDERTSDNDVDNFVSYNESTLIKLVSTTESFPPSDTDENIEEFLSKETVEINGMGSPTEESTANNRSTIADHLSTFATHSSSTARPRCQPRVTTTTESNSWFNWPSFHVADFESDFEEDCEDPLDIVSETHPPTTGDSIDDADPSVLPTVTDVYDPLTLRPDSVSSNDTFNSGDKEEMPVETPNRNYEETSEASTFTDNNGEEGCNADELACGNDTCIPTNKECDGIVDCLDASDEAGCDYYYEKRVENGQTNPSATGGSETLKPSTSTCSEFEHSCDGRCINAALVCDDVRHCQDGSDEHDCGHEGSAPCPSMDFSCSDGSCIPKYSVCDGFDDCPRAEDELHCDRKCTPTQFKCVIGNKCIDDVYRCDGHPDCPDRSDEDCDQSGPSWVTGRPRECDPRKEMRCDDGKCVLLRRKCDNIFDCLDGSDERDCGICTPAEWKCASGECLPEAERCDGITQCPDGSDETGCVTECPTGMFRCKDGLCLNFKRRCDGRPNCLDGSDEINCHCPEGKAPCDNGVCIDKNFFCDNNPDCHDGSDEYGCPDTSETTEEGGDSYPSECHHDEFTCRDGSCILQSAVCDGRADCPQDDDELNCRHGCTREQFQCANGDCISANQKCDGVINCDDGSDEPEECETDRRPTPGRCAAGQFMCIEDQRCVPQSSICNGIPECRDRSDEMNCGTSTTGSELNLKTYPSEQVIKENPAKQGREVVFQCRDEGPLRARVHWTRGNNLPLPPGSRDNKGRLEIPNIQLEHAGTYVCEALGYPAYTPGQQVSVHLSVEKFEQPSTRAPQVCQYDQATCSNGDCIPKSYVCNGKLDCTDGSDEMRCSLHGCEPNQFSCNNKQCVSKVWRCDGDNDCADGSDEENCAPAPPGSPCKYNQFSCSSNDECIPKSYHCDMERDCRDGSDEIGCSPVYIIKPPPPMVVLESGDSLTLTCTAIGVPTPEINWRLNWGHVPSKCSSISVNGTGTLTCPDIQIENQGAYSCEGLNTAGFVFAVPDAIVIVKERPGANVCPKDKFNSEARVPEECISCFCFGVATECHSANLFTYQLPPPFERHKILPVSLFPELQIGADISNQFHEIRSIDHNGIQLMQSLSNELNSYNIAYYPLPESYHRNQLKSYGGYLRYTVQYIGSERPNSAPAVILSGNDYKLIYKGKRMQSGVPTNESVRFFYGDWLKEQGRHEVLATREEIMMTLANVDNILIKAQYDDSPQLDVRITNIVMDTAKERNTGLGSAAFVEECQCPTGYSGLSCENCAPGYLRRESGPWLGQCYAPGPPCPPGYYGDPSRNIPCQTCPCPLTNPANQFSRTCHLGSDGQPTCNCPAGYVGRRCEQCAVGYQGNPLIPGDMCVPVQECDPHGSLSTNADPITGQCRCKQYATGDTCNKCKANTFNLASKNQFGCIGCFCMGIANTCASSNWYRNEIRVSFTNSIRDFSLIESQTPDAPPIVDGIRLNTITREIVYDNFPNHGSNDVYYWQLPSLFLGDQITSYGGNLRYTVRYVPSPGGQSSRNNAADVELISANNINLLYFSRESPEPNTQQTFTVPLLEQYWQRNDGTVADREHLLMALADVRAIRIKATYTTHTDEAALILVSLDTADKYNTGKLRAVEVEECACPAGYRGLSCEDCDVGYTRAMEGLYLGICEPCNCYNHSNQCHPETGVCENCAHHTTGDNCEICEPGYKGNATRGTPTDCTYRRPGPGPCICNAAGTASTDCIDGRCECKRNVEGSECNRCRPSTFGLSKQNIDGCIECYCNGVSNQCHESSLYIQQIPMAVYDSQHGFTLTDATRQDVIDRDFELNIAMNEIGYRYTDNRSRRLFWSLPAVFTGNKIKSYGGNLNLTQHITAQPGARSYKDQDIILVGNGITLFWTNPIELELDIPLAYSVPLKESEWRRLTIEGPRSASRADLMTVLSNLEAILVRATHSERMTATYISDISLDTAVENLTGNKRATQVEACRCPPGYTGTSCESCARGHYRDPSDRSRSFLGSCNPCPCNQNEESCEISRTGHVKCHCLPGYTGQYCHEFVHSVTTTPIPNPTISPPRITVLVQEPEFQIVHTGNTVRYHCIGRSLDRDVVHVKWEKEGGQLPPGRSVDDAHGLLVIRDVKVSDSGIYVCEVSDGINVGIKKVTLNVGGTNPLKPRAIITPQYMEVKEGDPVEFQCEASGNPPPQVEWVRVHGPMSPEATFYNGVWRLRAASKSDAAEYKCIAKNNVGVHEENTILYVRDNPNKPSRQELPPIVTPDEWSGTSGDVVRLTCTPSQRANVTWTRSGNLPLPYSATQRDGVLMIMTPKPSDSGLYVCTTTSYSGTVTSTTARITIIQRRDPPSVKVKPDRQTVSQGSVAEVRCLTNGEPGLQVKWSKHAEIMSPNAQQVGDTLRIVNIRVSDRGVYICRVTGPTGSHDASAIIEVEPREAPALELYPRDVQTVILGGSADFQCRATAGLPMPEQHWSRRDGRPFTPNIEQLPGGLLRLSNITIHDGGAYICSASNEVGSTSVVAHIEVQSMPVISVSPYPNNGILRVNRGDRVRLTCSAFGHPQPNVAWSKHINGLSVYDSFSKTAAKPLSAVYEIFSVSADDEGSYTCQATNDVGIIEERIQIRIEDDNETDNPPCRGDIPCENPDREPNPDNGEYKPKIHEGVRIPEDFLRIPNGGKVEMRCHVTGPEGNHIYLDWKRSDHRPLPEGSTVHNGVLSIPAVDKSAAGEYVCQGVDSAGNVLFKAKSDLKIISPPRIDLNPTRQTVRPGENPSIRCTATGDEPLSIEWAAIGRDLPYSVTHNGGVLQFHGIADSDAGKYVCKATNDAGTAEAVAEVLVNEHTYDDTYVRAAQKDVVTNSGNSVRLRCEVREHATIHWSREGQSLPPTAKIGEDYLELTQVKPEDSGRYICQIQNAHGVSSDYINFSVSPYQSQCKHREHACGTQQCIPLGYVCDGYVHCNDGTDEIFCRVRQYRQYLQRRRAVVIPEISVEVSQDPVNIGDTIDIRCACSGARNPRYRWSRPNHSSLPSNALEYGNVLRLTNVGVIDSGLYRCTADTPEGTFEEDFNLVVHGGHNDAPAIETKHTPYGSNLEMDCRVDLDPPIKFHWNKLEDHLPRNTETYESKLKLFNVTADDAGTYICTANNDVINIEVPTVLVVTGVVPNFNQAPKSFIALPPLPDSYLKFNIEVSFKPQSYDGIILYNEESSRESGDFVILSLVQGYPQFRFNLGSGAALIRADKPITLDEWHTIKLQRDRKEGTMLVDGEGPYKGLAAGRRQGLDLKEPLYVGGVPHYERFNNHDDSNTGFVGCISRLVIGEKQVDLIGDQTDSIGITNCETCAENPCNNAGVCQETATRNGYTCLCRAGYSGKHCDFVGQSCYPGACGEGSCVDHETGFTCYCPYGKTGSRCEHSLKIYDPAFHDDKAFIAHETPKALRRLKVAMNFNALDNEDGILMYCSQSDEGLGDFAALVVKDRRIEFRYDIGSGPAIIKSKYPLQPGVWTHVAVSRDYREGKLIVNGEPAGGKSPGTARSMTLNTPLYIGGVDRRRITVNRNAGVDHSFRGCISDLEVNSTNQDILKSAIDSAYIDNCNALHANLTQFTPRITTTTTTSTTTPFDPCLPNPCNHGRCQNTGFYEYSCTCDYGYVGRNCEKVLKQCELRAPCRNGGSCTDLHGSYKCDCRLGYNGQNCENLAAITYDVAFRGDGWLELDRSVMTHEEEREVLGFEISTNKTDGLIMWHGQTPNDLNPDDYIALAVVNGYVEYQYNLGSGPAIIRVTAQRVDDGDRHRIILKRQGSDGSIELNGEHMESGLSDGLQQYLNTRGSVYLGGVPDYSMTYGKYREAFSGCIYTMEVQDSGAIDIGEKAIRGKNVSPCTSSLDDALPTRGDIGTMH